MSIAKQTSPKGANAHGHYTLSVTTYSIPLPTKLLADQLHLQIYPTQIPIPLNTRSSRLTSSLSSPTSARAGLIRSSSPISKNAMAKRSAPSADVQNATSLTTAPALAVTHPCLTSTKTTVPKDRSCVRSVTPGSPRLKAASPP